MSNSFITILWTLIIANFFLNVKCYSQISTYGSGMKDQGPRIFKAINADLLFPETFNSTNNVISTTHSSLVSTTTPSLSNNQPLYTKDSVNDMPMAETSLIYVTPPMQTSLKPQMLNEQTMESNQMQSDYPKQPLQEEAFEIPLANDNQQQQKQHHHHQQQQQEQHFTSTGRAVDYRPAYQLDQFMNAAKPYKATPLPYAIRTTSNYPRKGQTATYNGAKVPPYPQNSYQYQRPLKLPRRPTSQAEVYKLSGKGEFSDRFTPGEAVASSLFTQNKHKHNHSHNQSNKVAESSNLIQSYTPPKDLYAFPPNINAKYPKPSDDTRESLASISINSYVPPPSGPLKTQANYPLVFSASNNEGYKYSEPAITNEGYKYNGPVHPAYLPPNGIKNEKPQEDMKPNIGSSDTEGDDGDNSIGVLPASAMGNGPDDDKVENSSDDMKDMNDMGTMPTGDADHDHNHDHDQIHGHPPIAYDTGKEYPTPPPGWMEEHPPHDHGSAFPYFSHNYPEIIYDDHHHDFHHDHHHIEPPPTTLPPPPEPLPSEQPQEPRVKKYSYFYIGRKLWYIPLYFTVWFSFYVLWLILKSIARHKVNLPNHYVARRSLPNYTDENAQEIINRLTISVLQHIDTFHQKYKT